MVWPVSSDKWKVPKVSPPQFRIIVQGYKQHNTMKGNKHGFPFQKTFLSYHINMS